MSDAENLFLILSLLYVIECAVWIRPGTFVLSTQFGLWFRITNLRWALLRNYDGGVLFGNLLPVGETFVCEQWPVSLSPEGVYAYVSQTPSSDGRPHATERYVRFKSLTKVEFQGNQLFLNGVVFAKLASPAFARLLARLIERLRTTPVDDRAPLIRNALACHLDAATARTRLTKFRRITRDLRVTNATMVFLVLIYPLLVMWLDPFVLMSPLIFGYLGLHLLAMTQFWFAHRRLDADHWKDRLKHLFLMMVSPADAMHGRDKLARSLLAESHPLVAAHALCPPEVFDPLAADAWRDLLHPMLPVCPLDEPGPRSVETWFREEFARAFETFLREAGVDRATVTAAPPPDETALSFCERCQSQFVIPKGVCAGCGDRPLIGFRESHPDTAP